jgi:hypothetical protein
VERASFPLRVVVIEAPRRCRNFRNHSPEGPLRLLPHQRRQGAREKGVYLSHPSARSVEGVGVMASPIPIAP